MCIRDRFHTNLELGFQYQDDELLFNKVRIATFEPMVKRKSALLISVQDLSSIVNPVLNPQRIKSKRMSQLLLTFGGAANQPEPAFFNAAIKKVYLSRVDTLNPATGGIAIQINRKAIEDSQKKSGVTWTYLSDQEKVALNHRNVALATSISAYLKGFKNMEVDKVQAKQRAPETNVDLVIDLAVEAVDEEAVWTAVLQSLQKFNYSLGR